MVVSYELTDMPDNYINDCLEALIKDAEESGVNYSEVAYAHFEFNFIYSLDDSGVGEFPNGTTDESCVRKNRPSPPLGVAGRA